MFRQSAIQPLARPGQWLDYYPQERADQWGKPKRWWGSQQARLRARNFSFRTFKRHAKRIQAHSDLYFKLEGDALLKAAGEVAAGLRRAPDASDLEHAFGLVDAQVRHVKGFRMHPEQLYCTWVLMHGLLGEMATGEGKSVTAAACAMVAALGGAPAHVITTNDYLVERDAEGMRDIADRLAISVSFVLPDMSDEEKIHAYQQDICYVSNKQLVFDYLRDGENVGSNPNTIRARAQGLVKSGTRQTMLRGLCFAIVDEADSVFVDDAVTPLILSRQVSGQVETAQVLTALSLARRLEVGCDFVLERRNRQVNLTQTGEDRLAEYVVSLDGIWKNRRYRHELVRQALSAIHLFERDVDYLVREGGVMLIDQSTGRVMPDRKLQHGLHQMVELKERCEMSDSTEAIASLSFQNFFQRYKHLCGMTGTAKEASTELRSVYRLGVVSIPTHEANLRKDQGWSFAQDEKAHMDCIVDAVLERQRSGQPVLIGTRSLATSEQISSALKHKGITHELLNARQDKSEADVVALAGQAGAVTVATNMAGRGTDIPVGAQQKECGGLHVIIAELNDNARIDRQLIGRCARQSDPGSYEYVLNVNDKVLRDSSIGSLVNLVGKLPAGWQARTLSALCKFAQRRRARQQVTMRANLAEHDRRMQQRLAFSGRTS